MSYGGGPVLRIGLTGSFSVQLADGSDATPRAAKAQALLALLATSRNGTRSRSWLQARLWSDRAPEQASGSLRQCLVQVRQALGDAAHLVDATRQKVSLDLDQVDLHAAPGEEYLEGLDVRDDAFEDWLRLHRAREVENDTPAPAESAPVPQTASPLKLIVIRCQTESDDARGPTSWLARLISDDLARHLRETFSVDVIIGDVETTRGDVWHVNVDVCGFGPSTVGVRLTLSRSNQGLHVWSGSRNVEMKGAPPHDHPDVVVMSNELIEAIGDELFLWRGPNEDCPDTLCRHAIRNMFTLRPDTVANADRMFDRAFDLQARGLYLAWRAQTKTIMKVERHGQDGQALTDEAEALCARALELEPNNSMVLATVANTYGMILRNHDKGMFLAERSTSLNPSNPMAWFSLSSASIHAGKRRDALRYTLLANRLATTSPHRFWWDSQMFAAALMNGRLGEATHFAEKCIGQNEDFRPPLRYLIALYAHDGREEDAVKIVERLTTLEPDFSIDRLVNDRDYPAALLRSDIGLDIDRVAALA